MSFSKLKLNPDKNEFIVFGPGTQCQKISCDFPVNTLHNLLHPADTVTNPGVWSDFSFSEHACMIYRHYFLQMCDLCRIRQNLTHKVLQMHVVIRVICNSLLKGLPSFNLHTLQSI